VIPPPGSKIALGMSGGVDSSVAAALLKDQGFDVTGLMLRLWSEQGVENRCCASDAQSEARYVAGLLEIPFYIIDAQDPFYQQVVIPFIDGYAKGVTPNPCLDCNRSIRWGLLRNRAKTLGADYIATGHYARINNGSDGAPQLLKGIDTEKDQSYVLHVLRDDDLKKTYFPLGELTKVQVRKLAKDYSLPVADRPDSQDLCFVGSGDYRDFLRKANPSLVKPGPIQDLHGNQIGEHDGLVDFTIGQRKGLRISGSEPYYVVKKDVENNALIIGLKSDLGQKEFLAGQVNWIAGKEPAGPLEAMIKTRYKSKEIPGEITPQVDNNVKIRLYESQPDVTPGQAAVFYQDDLCLGGGIIQVY
jgi:tRNA-specific 2-thiouridylase